MKSHRKLFFVFFIVLFFNCAFENNCQAAEIHCQNNKCALFKDNLSDKLLLPLEYDKIEDLHRQLYYKAQKNGKWELYKLDKKIKRITKDTFDEIFYFNYGSFFVKNSAGWHLFNTTENTFEPVEFGITDIRHNRYIVEKNGKYGLYRINNMQNYAQYEKHGLKTADLSIEPILPIKFDDLKFTDTDHKMVATINKEYKIIEFKDGFSRYDEKPLKTSESSKKQVNNKKAENTVKVNPKKGTIFKKGDKYGYKDKKGVIKLEPIYDNIFAGEKYAPNYLVVEKNDKYAVYKISSNKLSDFKYDMVFISLNTTMIAYDGQKKKVYDKKGFLRLIGRGSLETVAFIFCIPNLTLFCLTWPIAIANSGYGDFIEMPFKILDAVHFTPHHKEYFY